MDVALVVFKQRIPEDRNQVLETDIWSELKSGQEARGVGFGLKPTQGHNHTFLR